MARSVSLSIVISTKNEATNLPHLLSSIRRQDYKDFEIVVVDNFSSDETGRLARLYTSNVYLTGGERSVQRNFGAKKSRGKYLLFLDADMELLPNTLSACFPVMTQPRTVAVTIPEDVKGKKLFDRVKRLEKRLYWNDPLIEAPRFFRKISFFKIGGYSESLIAGEDWDISERIAHIGRIARSTVPLLHNETSLLRELKHKLYYAQNITQYAYVHPGNFQKQSGLSRINLLLSKRELLARDVPAAIGLFLLKGLEYMLYRLMILYSIVTNLAHTKN